MSAKFIQSFGKHRMSLKTLFKICSSHYKSKVVQKIYCHLLLLFSSLILVFAHWTFCPERFPPGEGRLAGVDALNAAAVFPPDDRGRAVLKKWPTNSIKERESLAESPPTPSPPSSCPNITKQGSNFQLAAIERNKISSK